MINIKVLKDYAEVSYSNSQGRSQVKVVALSDIPNLFDTKITFDSGILPVFGETNAYGVQRIMQRDDQIIVFVQCINPFLNVLHTENSELSIAQKKALRIDDIDVKYSDIVALKDEFYNYKNIYFPNLLMSISYKKDSKGKYFVEHSGLLCYKENFINNETMLYAFPFSNTYKDSTYGQICWGAQKADSDSISQSVGLIHTFFSGVMNTHLFNKIDINGMEIKCSSELLEYLATRSSSLEAFPYKDIPLKKIIKYSDLLSYVSQNWK